MLKNIPNIKLPSHKKKYISSNHLFIVNLNKPNLNLKEKLIKFMLKNKIILQYHYIPIYKFKIFKGKYINKNAEIYYNSAFSLPIYYGLSNKQQIYIAKQFENFFINN